MVEECGICGGSVSYSHTVHVLINSKDEEGVRDYDVCRRCYEEELEPLLS